MSETIRRRSLPDSFRWIADKLEAGPLTDAERVAHAMLLRMLADEMTPDPASCTCGVPQGRSIEDQEIRNSWEHSRNCPLKSTT